MESTQHLVGVLAGLNRLYFTTFQFKRMGHFLAQMQIRPDNLALRLNMLFRQDLHQSLPALEQLVDETIALVEAHMPEIDTTQARRRLGWRQEAWREESPGD